MFAIVKRIILVLLIAAIPLGLFSGCEQSNSEEPVLSVTDSNGSQISLQKSPERVAVLFSSFADIWVTAGGSVDITVEESIERGFADSTAVLVDSGAGKSIDTEALIAAKPDLVIGSADVPAQCDAVRLCTDAGIPAGVFHAESFDDYLQVLKTFTDITGCKENYQQFGIEVQQKIQSHITDFQSNDESRSILFIRSGSSARSMKAKATPDHFVCQMLNELGMVNIADSAPVLLEGLSVEEILLQDPDYIFISTMGDEDAAMEYTQSVLSQPQWQALQAVQNDNVIYLPKDLFQYKPNSRWAEAYQYLIDILNES